MSIYEPLLESPKVDREELAVNEVNGDLVDDLVKQLQKGR
jgi:hypothetical protein